MELEKFKDKQVAQISALQETSNQLRARASKLIVSDEETLKAAKDIIKDINAHKREVSDRRKALTNPFNSVIDQLISKEKEVLLPLDEGKTNLSDKMITYAEDVERKRREEAERIDVINNMIIDHYDAQASTAEEVDAAGASLKKYFEGLSEADKNNPTIKVNFMTTVGRLADRKNQIIEEARIEAERVRQAEEQKRLDAEREKQSEEEARIAQERHDNEEAKRKIEEDKLQIQRDKEEIERQKEIQKAEAEALKLEKQTSRAIRFAPKINKVTTANYEIVDEFSVPREYCSPDMTKIRAAFKAAPGDKPFEIPGVKVVLDTKVR